MQTTETTPTPTNAEIMAALARLTDAATLGAKNVLTFEDVCALTGYKPNHLKKLMQNGSIPYFRPNGGKVFFSRADLEKWQMQNPQNHTAPDATKAATLARYING